jgi:hypothetical protein
MALRALAFGAAEGFAEWGDRRAFPVLFDHATDLKNNEHSRMAACAALGWVAGETEALAVISEIKRNAGNKPPDNMFQRGCLLEAFLQRGIPGTQKALLELLVTEDVPALQHRIARAIAKAGLDEATERALFEMAKHPLLRAAATLALLLGGSTDTALRALSGLVDVEQPELLEVAGAWARTFSYVSVEDLESGELLRRIAVARALARMKLGGARQTWALQTLRIKVGELVFDNGPHSLTRAVLRYRLWQLAKSDAAKSQLAIDALELLNEAGVLFALSAEPPRVRGAAFRAYFRALNPAPISGPMPEFENRD